MFVGEVVGHAESIGSVEVYARSVFYVLLTLQHLVLLLRPPLEDVEVDHLFGCVQVAPCLLLGVVGGSGVHLLFGLLLLLVLQVGLFLLGLVLVAYFVDSGLVGWVVFEGVAVVVHSLLHWSLDGIDRGILLLTVLSGHLQVVLLTVLPPLLLELLEFLRHVD